MRTKIRNLITDIIPHDELEQAHKKDILEWIDSGAPLCRIAKPDTPPKHLVAYFAVFDEVNQSLLVIDHRLAGLWLLTGGHVDNGEHPNTAAVREAKEELGLQADFYEAIGERPLFTTVREVVNADDTGRHTDVSLWYVLHGSVESKFDYDESEFTTYKWLTFDEILATDIVQFDPHMHRFVHKLKGVLSE